MQQQLRERGIDPTSPECERTMVVAGGIVGQLLASPETMAMLANNPDDEQRGGIAALLVWSSAISPHETEALAK